MSSSLKLINKEKYTANSNKIPAIKAVRSVFNMGLKEAKSLVEDVTDANKEVVIPDAIVLSDSDLKNQLNDLRSMGLELNTTGSPLELIDALKKAATIAINLDNFSMARSILSLAEKAST